MEIFFFFPYFTELFLTVIYEYTSFSYLLNILYNSIFTPGWLTAKASMLVVLENNITFITDIFWKQLMVLIVEKMKIIFSFSFKCFPVERMLWAINRKYLFCLATFCTGHFTCYVFTSKYDSYFYSTPEEPPLFPSYWKKSSGWLKLNKNCKAAFSEISIHVKAIMI